MGDSLNRFVESIEFVRETLRHKGSHQPFTPLSLHLINTLSQHVTCLLVSQINKQIVTLLCHHNRAQPQRVPILKEWSRTTSQVSEHHSLSVVTLTIRGLTALYRAVFVTTHLTSCRHTPHVAQRAAAAKL